MLDIDIGLRLGVVSAVERQNLSMYMKGIRRTGNEPPPIAALELLLEFTEQKIQKAMQDGNTRQGAQALCELECVLRDLVRFGHKEFEETLRRFEGGWRRVLVAARTRLVQDYLDPATSPENADRINSILCEIIRRGAWPNWRREYSEAVEATSPSIAPTLKAG
jgi:hypothetical protein